MLLNYILFSVLTFFAILPKSVLAAPTEADWYMVGANPQRTSWVSEEVAGNLEVEWYQAIEPYIHYVFQPIFYNDKAYISSAKGLYVFNLADGDYSGPSGRLDWVYATDLPLGNSPTIAEIGGTVVAFTPSYDHTIHAIDVVTHTDRVGYTPYQAGAGFSTNPLVIGNVIYAGNRDGKFYALNATTGALIWSYQTGDAILFSAAYKDGVVYFASNDLYAYALNATNGAEIWKSAKLPGAGFFTFWPVVYTEKASSIDYVVFTAAENYRTSDGMTQISLDSEYIVPGCRNVPNSDPCPPNGTILYPQSTAPPGDPVFSSGTRLMDVTKLTNYYETDAYPLRRATFVLKASDGSEYTFDSDGDGKAEYAPFNYANTTSSGTKYPVVVNQNDDILYSSITYSSLGWIPRSHPVGWKFGSHEVSLVSGTTNANDEPIAVSGGGNLMYYSLLGDRSAGAFNVTIPYGTSNRSWVYYDYNLQYDANTGGLAPDYQLMYHNGDVEFYNNDSGWHLYSGKNQSYNGIYGKHMTSQSPPIPYKDKVYTLKGNSLIALSPSVSTPVHLPLIETVTETTSYTPINVNLSQKLETEVQNMYNAGHLRPGYLGHGSDLYGQGNNSRGYLREIGEVFDYFQNPAETVVTLIDALPHLSAPLQAQIRSYIQNNYGPGGTYPITSIVHVGWQTGAAREATVIPPEALSRYTSFGARTTPRCNKTVCGWDNFPPYSFYAAWKYAEEFGGATAIFNAMSSKLETLPTDSDTFFTGKPYVMNQYIAGYLGYLNLQVLAGYPESSSVRATYNQLLADRIRLFTKDVQGLRMSGTTAAYNYMNVIAVARNFMYLTPELATYLNTNYYSEIQTAMNEYEYVAPYWNVTKFDATIGEATIHQLYDTPALFQAKAYILGKSQSQLMQYLDVPAFKTGDLFYIQNLVAALEAPTDPADPPTPTPAPPTATATPVPPTPTPACVDNTAPIAPTISDISCSADTNILSLTWTSTTDQGCAGLDALPYSSVASLSSGYSPFVTGWNTSWQNTTTQSVGDSSLSVGTTVYVIVRARDASLNLSVGATGLVVCSAAPTPTATPIPTATPTGSPLTISGVTDNRAIYPSSQIPQYEKMEITFDVATTATNLQLPYDASPPSGVTPSEGITVNAQFLPPGEVDWQNAFLQPAFYYQDFDYQVKSGADWIYPNGNYNWKVRFSPNETGEWQYKLSAQDSSGTTESVGTTFTVVASNNKGFVRVSTNDTRYFEYDNGSPFVGLGYNMNYDNVSFANPVTDNQANFETMGQNGIELIRIWLSQWSIFGSTWNPWNSVRGDQDGQMPRSGLSIYGKDDPVSSQLTLTYAEDGGGNKNTYWFDACRYIGEYQASPSIKQNTTYHITIRYRGEGISGPRNGSYSDYGFVGKIQNPNAGGRHSNCFEPGEPTNGVVVTSYGGNSANWTNLEGEWTSTTQNYLPNFYLAMENVNNTSPVTNWHPYAYIDTVEIKEDLGGGNYGPNILSNPSMDYLKYYSQKNSFGFDKALELAEANNIKFRLVTLEKEDVIQRTLDVGGSAVESSYSNFYGVSPSTYVRWYQKAWWRYAQARWGYSPSVHTWELVNEGDPLSSEHSSMADDFGKYMHCQVFGQTVSGATCTAYENPLTRNPNSHLSTTSNWLYHPADFWNDCPNCDYTDLHRYVPKTGGVGWYDPNFYDSAKSTYDTSMAYGAQRAGGFNKPVIRGELGFVVDTNGAATTELLADTQAVWLHNFVWGGINSGGMLESYWYDNYDANGHINSATFDYRPIFKTYYDFINTVPINNGHYVDVGATSSDAGVRVWGQKDLTNQKAHMWISNANHTWKNVVDGVGITAIGTTVVIGGFNQNTNYRIEWWNTYTGAVGSTEFVSSDAGGSINLNVNGLTTDVAAKILLSTEIEPTATPVPPTATPIPPTATPVPPTTTPIPPTPTTACVDNTAPIAPTISDISCSADTNTLSLTWSSTTDQGCAGLNALPYSSYVSFASDYSSSISGWNASWQNSTTQSLVSETLTVGTTVYVRVRARDASSNISSLATNSVVCSAAPTPTATPSPTAVPASPTPTTAPSPTPTPAITSDIVDITGGAIDDLLTNIGSGITLTIPNGQTVRTTFTFTRRYGLGDTVLPNNYVPAGSYFTFEAVDDFDNAVGQFGQALTLIYRPTAEELSVAGDIDNLNIAYYDPTEDSWPLVPCLTLSASSLTCTITHFTFFASVVIASPTIAPTPTTAPTTAPTSAPVPTSTSTPQNNNNSNNSSSNNSSGGGGQSSSSCTGSAPGTVAEIFRIDTTNTSAKIYFSPAKDADKYQIYYGTKPNSFEFATEYHTDSSNGVRSFIINYLRPRMTYYFKVLPHRGCVPGIWSNVLPANTTASKTARKTILLKKPSTTKKVVKQVNTNVKSPIANPQVNIPTETMLIPTSQILEPIVSPVKTEPEAVPVDATLVRKKKCILWWCF